MLLKPKLAYQASRDRGNAGSDLREALEPCLDEVSKGKDYEAKRERFLRFVDFFEAILAYHREKGGR